MTGSAEYAPIALFAYARVDHLAATVDSLLTNVECEKTHLHVYCDGPRSVGHQPQIDQVRVYVDGIKGFASVTRLYRDQNLGLARSIINGVNEILTQYETVIVMEDDLVVSPHFLKFMNEGLQLYRNEERVASIHGYCYPVPEALPETFFLRGADCWGWATWARAWRYFESNGQKLLNELERKELIGAFDLDGAYSYSTMLANQVNGANDSWAVRWHAACFLRNMLTLYPGRSLVNNIGNDGSGTHCATTNAYEQVVAVQPISINILSAEESVLGREAVKRYLKKQHSLSARVLRRIRTLLK